MVNAVVVLSTSKQAWNMVEDALSNIAADMVRNMTQLGNAILWLEKNGGKKDLERLADLDQRFNCTVLPMAKRLAAGIIAPAVVTTTAQLPAGLLDRPVAEQEAALTQPLKVVVASPLPGQKDPDHIAKPFVKLSRAERMQVFDNGRIRTIPEQVRYRQQQAEAAQDPSQAKPDVEVRRNKIIINKPMTFTPKELMDLATQALAKGFYGKDPTP